MEETEPTSHIEIEVRDEDENVREPFQVQMESNESKKNDTEKEKV